MAARDKREVRVVNMYNWYNLYKNGLITLEQAKANVEYNKQVLFEGEVAAVAKKYPAVDIADFTEFLNQSGGLKKAGKHTSTGVGHTTYLNTAEAAIDRGVVETNIATYTDLVNTVYEACRELNKLMDKARCSFAIPMKKVEAKTPQA